MRALVGVCRSAGNPGRFTQSSNELVGGDSSHGYLAFFLGLDGLVLDFVVLLLAFFGGPTRPRSTVPEPLGVVARPVTALFLMGGFFAGIPSSLTGSNRCPLTTPVVEERHHGRRSQDGGKGGIMTVDSGGVDLGTFGQVGQGGMPGLATVQKFLSRGPEWHELYRASRMPGKDFNDQPV